MLLFNKLDLCLFHHGRPGFMHQYNIIIAVYCFQMKINNLWFYRSRLHVGDIVTSYIMKVVLCDLMLIFLQH